MFDAKAPPSGEPLLRIAPLLTPTELDTLWQTVLEPAFVFLEKRLHAQNIALVDIKLEVGYRKSDGALVIADVIDNDSWRIWPNADPAAQLDKQGFRDDDADDAVLRNYARVSEIVERF